MHADGHGAGVVAMARAFADKVGAKQPDIEDTTSLTTHITKCSALCRRHSTCVTDLKLFSFDAANPVRIE